MQYTLKKRENLRNIPVKGGNLQLREINTLIISHLCYIATCFPKDVYTYTQPRRIETHYTHVIYGEYTLRAFHQFRRERASYPHKYI